MLKKILFGFAAMLSLAACTGDYTDWAEPQHNDQPATVTFGNGSVAEVATIDLAAIEEGQELVQVCNITAPTASAEGYAPEYTITLGEQTFALTTNGEMNVAELSDYVVKTYGQRPVERAIPATIAMWVNNGTTAVKTATSAVFNVKAVPEAPVIEDVYYLTGTMNGWNNSNTDYALVNGGGDVYADPVFKVVVPCDGNTIEFKVTPASGVGGDWSKCLCASENEGEFIGNNAGGNFVIPALDAAFVEITFNMLEQTWSYTGKAAYETWYLIGDDIANGQWHKGNVNEIGVSIIPMGVKSVEESNILVWTGYLAGNGFKLVKTIGDNWNDQWGQGSTFGEYWKNNGGSGNITVPSAGYYTVTLDVVADVLTVEPYAGTPTDYSSMGIAGSINGWSFDAMTACHASNNHDWYTNVTSTAGDEVKLGANCDWGTNWGDTAFPYGVGANGGTNIPVSAGNWVVVFNDITGAYTFIAK